MIPLAIPDLNGNEARYLQECVQSTFVSSVGAFVDRFEGLVAEAAGCAGAVAVSSGTAALHAALTAVGVGRDDLVIMPSYTFIATANAVAQCGATPWLMDVEPVGWGIDPEMTQQALSQECERVDGVLRRRACGRRVAAVLPVQPLGNPCRMEAVTAVARGFELPVISDAAAALGATRHGKPVGELGADLTCFSFNGNKTVTCGGGGAVAGQDAELLARVKHLTTTARVGPGYDHDVVGFNYRMTNLQAAVGCAQMERLAQLVGAKRAIHARYVAAFADISPELRPFAQASGSEGAWWFSGIMLEGDTQRLARLRDDLRAAGVDARPFWKPMHLQTPYLDAPRSAMAVSDAIWQGVLPLPSSTGLRAQQQQQVIDALLQAL
ncbi:DegT/DnrJ/EryC1/StrS family aminotransferase [Magnetofaba australis]|nr:DegT/DnrJ/EryC1/StrS family aminotransferase [Magnetofaba australis]